MKICSKCKILKDDIYFHKQSKTSSGLRSRCKECTLGYAPKIPTSGMKFCSVCGEEKLFIFFDKNSKSKLGISSQCKLCRSSIIKAKRLQARLIRKQEAALKISLITEKICIKCGILKNISEFTFLKTGTYRGDCRKCATKNSNLARRKKNLKLKYGLTPEEYDEMLKNQKNVCSICKNPENHSNSFLAVDHDHSTGKIRNLLCSSCNLLLGHAKDSIVILKNAIKYLKKHKT